MEPQVAPRQRLDGGRIEVDELPPRARLPVDAAAHQFDGIVVSAHGVVVAQESARFRADSCVGTHGTLTRTGSINHG